MITALIVYALLITPMSVLYARWFYRIDREAFGDVLKPNAQAALGFGLVLGSLWFIGWFPLILACLIHGINPFPGYSRAPLDRFARRIVGAK